MMSVKNSKIPGQQTAKSSTILRAKIILLANLGMKYQNIAQKLDVQKNIIMNWTGLLAGMSLPTSRFGRGFRNFRGKVLQILLLPKYRVVGKCGQLVDGVKFVSISLFYRTFIFKVKMDL